MIGDVARAFFNVIMELLSSGSFRLSCQVCELFDEFVRAFGEFLKAFGGSSRAFDEFLLTCDGFMRDFFKSLKAFDEFLSI